MIRKSFNDSWKFWIKNGAERFLVTLPHDAMIRQPRDPQSPSGSAQGFFPGGEYVYEKSFRAPEDFEKKHVVFQFEGVYKNAKVTLNGREAGRAAYGYIPFCVCADGLLQEGENIIRVECGNPEQPESRWYSGAGIYRPVWLWIGEKEHIEPEGIRITTLSWEEPRIRVTAAHTGGPECQVIVEILDTNRVIAECGEGDISLPGARLWSAETPYLYTCRVILKRGGEVCDSAETKFGVRKVEWSARGLFINGKNTKLRGGCVHHDNGILGTATFDESEYRRVRKLKEAGFNAIRSSHNPASRAMLEACDRYGVYLMDESWDMWFHHKNQFDYASSWRDHYAEDLKSMVSRDYNHPSVILYSIGNEVSEPAKKEGLAVEKEMVDLMHELDSSRPVTAGFNLMIIYSASKGKGIYKEEGGRNEENDKKMSGMNSTMFNMMTSMVGTGMNRSANSKAADQAVSPALDMLDLAGYNYGSGRYPLEGKEHPKRLIFGSETFPQDIAANWEMVEKYPYLAGDFMWTAWDYLGEAGLGAWAYTPDGMSFNKPYPWLLADCGAFDILGNPGAPVACAQAAWGLDEAPYIGVQPVNHPGEQPAKAVWRGTNAFDSWSWRGCEGNPAVVEIYSSKAEVELFLNGKSLGRKKPKLCKAVFKTKYVPGRLEAVAYDASGKECGRSCLISSEGKVRPRLKVENSCADQSSIYYVDVSLSGENGQVESNADERLTVTVTGGELLGFGSANPRTEDRFDAGACSTYYGRALAVVKSAGNGPVTVTAEGASGRDSCTIIMK